MFKKIAAFFNKDVGMPIDRRLLPEVATAALLVEAALIDGIYANIESDMIALILLDSFNLDADKVDAIMVEAEALAEQAVGAHQFTKYVKPISEEQRLKVIEGLYRVALSDGEHCPIEEAFIRHVSSLLHITDVPRAMARKRAEAHIQAAGD